MSTSERDARTATTAVNNRADELDEDDRAWLVERLEEYEDLLTYLREH